MEKKSISQIIIELEAISKIAPPEISVKIEQKILELKELNSRSKTDIWIERMKDLSELLGPIMKILYEGFINGS